MFEQVLPRQVVLVTSRAESEVLGKKILKDNVFTLAWHSPVSFSPQLYGILVGKERYSLGLIRKSKSFCINFIPNSMESVAVFCGSQSGAHIDKFEKAEIEKEECDTIDCPRLAEASAWIECELFAEQEFGDHVLIVGKVTYKQGMRSQRLFYSGKNSFTTTLKP